MKTNIRNRFYFVDDDIFHRRDSLSVSFKDSDQLSFNSTIDNYLFNKYFNENLKQGSSFSNLSDLNNFYFYTYKDSNFTFKANPVLGGSYFNTTNNDKILSTFNGLSFSGSYGKHIFFDGIFYDNHEDKHPLKNRAFSRETGFVSVVNAGDYGVVRGNIKLAYDWGTLAIGKENLNIGSGYDGKVILSSKAPAFPYLGYNVFPSDWLSFTFVHGWLNSGVTDSNSIRKSALSDSSRVFTSSSMSIQKFISLHYLTIKFSDLKISIGESIIYSDRLRYEYFIPVLFYRFMDHENSLKSSGNNAQMFAEISFIIKPVKTKTYFSAYIDELELTNLLKGKPGNNTIAYTLGFNTIDPLWSNSNFIFEYTRVMPFVYMNFNPAETFASAGYQLGHWIGSNADEVYASFRQFIGNHIYTSVWGELIRKGAKENIDDLYNKKRLPFLFGKRSYLYNIGVEVMYEPINNLRFYARYVYNLKSTGRFIDEYFLTEKNNFNFSISFGL